MLILQGVRSCLEYQRTRDIAASRAARNPDLSPHLSFLDFGGHGYSIVHATRDWLEVEFVCIPRPTERSTERDGGPLRYRVAHRVRSWGKGELPRLEQRVIEGDALLSI